MCKSQRSRWLLGSGFLWIGLLSWTSSTVALDDGPAGDPAPVHDPAEDSDEQINEALERARSHNRRVMLVFESNGCEWCEKLHEVFEGADKVQEDLGGWYEVVWIDTSGDGDQRHNAEINKRYDNPVRLGLPVVVILEQDGKALVTQDVSVFREEDQYDVRKVRQFLKKWRPAPENAETLFNTILDKAATDSKPVLVYFRKRDCDDCARLEAALAESQALDSLKRHFVLMSVDTDRMVGVNALIERFKKGEGYPWFAVLDSKGQLISQTGLDAGDGESDAAHDFIEALGEQSGMSAEQVDLLRERLSKIREKPASSS